MTQAKSQPMTAEQLLDRSSELGRCELVKGALIKMMPAGNLHGAIALRIGRMIGEFVDNNELGIAYAAETGFVLKRNPDTVRAPDAAFVRKARDIDEQAEGFIEGPPDLAVEVISPNDTSSAVGAKVEDWLHHGAQLVWVADPPTRTLTAYYADHSARIYHIDDTVPGEPVLAGFSLPLNEVFVPKTE